MRPKLVRTTKFSSKSLSAFSDVPDEVQEITIDPVLLSQSETLSEKCTIVRCAYNSFGWDRIRIWPSTYLIQENGIRKKMLHNYNIALYPEWITIKGKPYIFTLIFEGLDQDCISFDLLEDIPEPGEFHIRSIPRNQSDVYHVTIR
ncbi:MAG: hypothetical protein IPL09_07555 [Bacteroidetes bacterium]|nr:hypothetical protein [Bacteroidota bacterium]